VFFLFCFNSCVGTSTYVVVDVGTTLTATVYIRGYPPIECWVDYVGCGVVYEWKKKENIIKIAEAYCLPIYIDILYILCSMHTHTYKHTHNIIIILNISAYTGNRWYRWCAGMRGARERCLFNVDVHIIL